MTVADSPSTESNRPTRKAQAWHVLRSHMTAAFSPAWHEPFLVAAILTVLGLLAAGGLLDGGRHLRWSSYFSALLWAAAVVFALLRRSPSRLEKAAVVVSPIGVHVFLALLDWLAR